MPYTARQSRREQSALAAPPPCARLAAVTSTISAGPSYDRKHQQSANGRCGGDCSGRPAAVVCASGARPSAEKAGISVSIHGQPDIAGRADHWLERYPVLRVVGADNQPKTALHDAVCLPVFWPDGRLCRNGVAAEAVGSPNADARLVPAYRVAERAGRGGTAGAQFSIGYTGEQGPTDSMLPVAGLLMGQLCGYSRCRCAGPYYHREVAAGYRGLGACLVSFSGAGTRSGSGVGFLSSDIGFLIKSVASPMMEDAGEYRKALPSAATRGRA